MKKIIGLLALFITSYSFAADPKQNNQRDFQPTNNKPVLNSKIPSPAGINKFPQIVAPGRVTSSRIAPPPELALMNACQSNARGNLEASRKCFEGNITTKVQPQSNNSNFNIATYNKAMNEKIAYCKRKSGNNLSAYKFCVNTNEAPKSTESPSSQFISAAKSAQIAGNTPVPVARPNNAIINSPQNKAATVAPRPSIFK